MIQQRKKDYLQRLIEEFFAKFHELVNNGPLTKQQEQTLLHDAFEFFSINLGVHQDNDAESLINTIKNTELLEQYIKLLYKKYSFSDIKEPAQLYKALAILLYIEENEKNYSWSRIVLRENLLNILEKNK